MGSGDWIRDTVHMRLDCGYLNIVLSSRAIRFCWEKADPRRVQASDQDGSSTKPHP